VRGLRREAFSQLRVGRREANIHLMTQLRDVGTYGVVTTLSLAYPVNHLGPGGVAK